MTTSTPSRSTYRDLGQALATYRPKIKPKFEDAGRAYAANVAPVAKAIDDDFAANGNRFPKEATTVKVGDLTKWSDEATEYDDKISNAQASLSVDDLAKVDPDYAYPGDSFPTEVP